LPRKEALFYPGRVSSSAVTRGFRQELGNIHELFTIDELFEKIAHHISYYNTSRIHSALKMPPRNFFEQWQRQQERSNPDIHSVH